MEPHDLIEVYAASDSFKADVIKNMLEDEGIRAFVEDENQAALPGLNSIEVKVMVEDSRAVEARKLIEEREEQVIADSLADMEKGEDEAETEDESESKAPVT